MTVSVCTGDVTMKVGDQRFGTIDFTRALTGGALLTGTPGITIAPSTGAPVLSLKTLNSVPLVNSAGKTIAIDCSTQVFIDCSSATAGSYTLTISVSTTTSEFIIRTANLTIEA